MWWDDYESAYNQAKGANESRYQDILAGYGNRTQQYNAQAADYLGGMQQRYQRGLGMVDSLGLMGQQDITDSYAQSAGRIKQSMIDRGLGNSSVQDSMFQGMQDDQEKAKMGLADSMARTRTQVDSQLSGDYLGAYGSVMNAQAGMNKDVLDFKERKTDAYPDPNVYAARDGGGMGGSGGANPFQAAWDKINGPTGSISNDGGMTFAPTSRSDAVLQANAQTGGGAKANPGAGGFIGPGTAMSYPGDSPSNPYDPRADPVTSRMYAGGPGTQGGFGGFRPIMGAGPPGHGGYGVQTGNSGGGVYEGSLYGPSRTVLPERDISGFLASPSLESHGIASQDANTFRQIQANLRTGDLFGDSEGVSIGDSAFGQAGTGMAGMFRSNGHQGWETMNSGGQGWTIQEATPTAENFGADVFRVGPLTFRSDDFEGNGFNTGGFFFGDRGPSISNWGSWSWGSDMGGFTPARDSYSGFDWGLSGAVSGFAGGVSAGGE